MKNFLNQASVRGRKLLFGLFQLRKHITGQRVLWAVVGLSILWNIYDSATDKNVDNLRFNAVLGWIMAGVWFSMFLMVDIFYHKLSKLFNHLMEDNLKLAGDNQKMGMHFAAIQQVYAETKVEVKEEKPTSH